MTLGARSCMMAAVCPRWIRPLTGLTLAIGVTACAGAGGAGAKASGPEIDAYLALCRMQTLVADGDVAAAEATFYDDAHATLHMLADLVQEMDRGTAADLLTSKTKVEEDLAATRPDLRTLAADVGALVGATAAALDVIGKEAPSCPEQR